MKTIFLIACLIICSLYFEIQAQTNDSTQVETILKINKKTGTPFKKSQLRWLNRSGFESTNYRWDNPEINKYLKKSIRQKNLTYVTTGTGVILGFTGLMTYVFIGVLESEESRQNARKRGNNLLLTSGAFFTGTIALSISSHNKIRKANKLRLKSK